jgi:hypothetical protein
LPVLRRVVPLGTVEIGDPDGRAMIAQDFLDDPGARLWRMTDTQTAAC